MFSCCSFLRFVSVRLTPAFITAILLVLLSLPSHAEQVSGLYDVAVPVDSQSSKALNWATKDGLKTVFIRVSGKAEIIHQPEITEAVRRASKMTRQFRYEQRTQADGSEALYAVIEFEQQLVDSALRQAGLPLWSSNRPTVLVWLVIDDAQGRRSIGAERDKPVVAVITENSRRRGLALKLPSLDLEDMVAVSVDELWQLSSWKAKSAAERYGADTILFGRVTQLTNGEVLGRWHYRYNQQTVEFDGEGSSINDFVAAGLDQVAELLAEQYAVVPVKIADGGVMLRLTGITNFTDYARAINYLESVAAIRHANVVEIEGDQIVVKLVADGSLSQLQQAFALGGRLLPQLALDSDYQGRLLLDLDYRWPATE